LSAGELARLEEMQAALEAQQAAALESGAALAALEAAPPADAGEEAREARQREIAQMVEQQPDEVAQLLRGWMSDRR
jgi:flagellar M-ring protein FliF